MAGIAIYSQTEIEGFASIPPFQGLVLGDAFGIGLRPILTDFALSGLCL